MAPLHSDLTSQSSSTYHPINPVNGMTMGDMIMMHGMYGGRGVREDEVIQDLKLSGSGDGSGVYSGTSMEMEEDSKFLHGVLQYQQQRQRGGGGMGLMVEAHGVGDHWLQCPWKQPCMEELSLGFATSGVGGGGGVRGKKRIVADDVVDKAAIQKQKRMIKNRESAARSRERKQCYIEDLESLARRLKEENGRLQCQLEVERKWLKKLQEIHSKVQDSKQPMEGKRLLHCLRRTVSM